MTALDELLARIDADLALPAFPPLELAVACPPRPPEPPTLAIGGVVSGAVELESPAPYVVPNSWWRRVFRRA